MNPGQEDANNNLVGDACDTLNDRDKDGVPDEVTDHMTSVIRRITQVDNCPDTPNTDQLDGLLGLEDGIGDACDDDDDNDGGFSMPEQFTLKKINILDKKSKVFLMLTTTASLFPIPINLTPTETGKETLVR